MSLKGQYKNFYWGQLVVSKFLMGDCFDPFSNFNSQTLSITLGFCEMFPWKLLLEYTICLGWLAAVAQGELARKHGTQLVGNRQCHSIHTLIRGGVASGKQSETILYCWDWSLETPWCREARWLLSFSVHCSSWSMLHQFPMVLTMMQ